LLEGYALSLILPSELPFLLINRDPPFDFQSAPLSRTWLRFRDFAQFFPRVLLTYPPSSMHPRPLPPTVDLMEALYRRQIPSVSRLSR